MKVIAVQNAFDGEQYELQYVREAFNRSFNYTICLLHIDILENIPGFIDKLGENDNWVELDISVAGL